MRLSTLLLWTTTATLMTYGLFIKKKEVKPAVTSTEGSPGSAIAYPSSPTASDITMKSFAQNLENSPTLRKTLVHQELPLARSVIQFQGADLNPGNVESLNGASMTAWVFNQMNGPGRQELLNFISTEMESSWQKHPTESGYWLELLKRTGEIDGQDPTVLEILRRESLRSDPDYTMQALQHYLSFETDKEKRREFIRNLDIPVETVNRSNP